jgi:hypothetical protein
MVGYSLGKDWRKMDFLCLRIRERPCCFLYFSQKKGKTIQKMKMNFHSLEKGWKIFWLFTGIFQSANNHTEEKMDLHLQL